MLLGCTQQRCRRLSSLPDLAFLALQEANSDPWRWQPHPEIWLLVISLTALYIYAIRNIGPTATRTGEKVVSRSQIAWFSGAMALLWLATDWPVHDIAEEYLYSVHMSQHVLLSLVIPPMMLLATPTWLARMVIGSGVVYKALRLVARPIPATFFFNAVVVLSHWPVVVNSAVSNGLLHYAMHVLVVSSALLMWLPVAGPLPELRFSLPVQMIYLFIQSIIPTVPAGWLTFAEGAVYRSYDHSVRVFGISVAYDQQFAGMIMKLVGGTYLWVVIFTLFAKFAAASGEDDRASGMALDRRAPIGTGPDGDVLTWEQVERELADLGSSGPSENSEQQELEP